MSLIDRASELWSELRGKVTPPPAIPHSPTLPATDADEPIDQPEDASPPAWSAEPITGRSFVLVYADSKGQRSERQVSCRRIESRAGTLYLMAYCHARQRMRTFRADRVIAIIDGETGELHEPGITFLAVFAPDAVSTGKLRFGLNPRTFADFNAALNVLAFMARCDGNWHELEASVIEDFAASFWLRAELLSDLDTDDVVRHTARLAPDAEMFYVSLLRCAGHPIFARLIRRYIGAMIDADGVHHPHELYWAQAADDFLKEQAG